MRRVRYSRTFIEQLDVLLAQGEPKFGARVVDEKRDSLYDAIDHYLVEFPVRRRDPDIGLNVYQVSKTPFLVIYDFDDDELRVFFVLHARADRSKIDPATAEW